MKTRTAIGTDGKKHSFSYDGVYYTPDNVDKEEIFKGFPNAKACVLYTKIVYDKGWRIGMLYGSPAIIDYNNGNVGYQNYNFFNTIEEAEKDVQDREKLSINQFTSDIAYCDVFLVIR